MKKIIALAVASAFIAPAALAEVTVYGGLRTGIEYSNIDDVNTYNPVTGAVSVNLSGTSRMRLVDQSSRLGFKGTEKLSNDLTVIWQAEQRIRVGSTNVNGTQDDVSWSNRDTMIGLQGSWGKVRAGRMDDLIDGIRGKYYGAMGSIEETSNLGSRFTRRGNDRLENAVIYESPSFGGFEFGVQYGFGSKMDATANCTQAFGSTAYNNCVTANGWANTNSQSYALTAGYKHKYFEIGAGYKKVYDVAGEADGVNQFTTKAVSDDAYSKTMMIGLSVMPMTGLKISAAWNRAKNAAPTTATFSGLTYRSGESTQQSDGWGLGVAYNTGNHSIMANYGELGDVKTNAVNAWNGNKIADSSANGFSLGYGYKLSKQTAIKAGFFWADEEVNSPHNTGNGTGVQANPGGDAWAMGVSLHHNF